MTCLFITSNFFFFNEYLRFMLIYEQNRKAHMKQSSAYFRCSFLKLGLSGCHCTRCFRYHYFNTSIRAPKAQLASTLWHCKQSDVCFICEWRWVRLRKRICVSARLSLRLMQSCFTWSLYLRRRNECQVLSRLSNRPFAATGPHGWREQDRVCGG